MRCPTYWLNPIFLQGKLVASTDPVTGGGGVLANSRFFWWSTLDRCNKSLPGKRSLV